MAYSCPDCNGSLLVVRDNDEFSLYCPDCDFRLDGANSLDELATLYENYSTEVNDVPDNAMLLFEDK